METLRQDLRYGLRTLIQKPLFTVIAVLSLALGIGANTTIFSLVNALLLRSLPVRAPERLVAVYTRDEKNPGFAPLSHLNWQDVRTHSRSFSQVLGYDWVPVSVHLGDEAAFLVGQMVSANYFDLLGVRMALGRSFAPEEDAPGGGHPVVVLSYPFWEDRLGADPKVVARPLVINGQPFTVIGVAARGFTGTDVGARPEFWVPMAMNRRIRPDPNTNWYEQRRGLFVAAIARLAPGATIRSAQQELDALFAHLRQEYPVDNKGRGARLVPFEQAIVNPNARQGLIGIAALLMTVVGLVLLIACANVANLLLTRASGRRREIAVRLSIGASRGRLVRQLLTESLLLALVGGAAGLLVALWANRGLMSLLPRLPFQVEVDLHPDLRVLSFTLGLALLTGLLFGLAPALQATRGDLVSPLKSQVTPAAAGRSRFTGRNLLIVAQVALSLVALIAAGLFLRSLGETQKADPGFETSRLLSLGFDLQLQGYDQPRGEGFLRQVLDRVRSLPGVRSVSAAQAGPLQGTMMRSVFLEGQEGGNNGTLIQVDLVAADYFATVGTPVVRGRPLGEEDRTGTLPAVVVNQTMADTFWPGKNPIGRRFRFFGDEQLVEVVGVARNAKYNGLGEDPQPYIYQPLGQRWTGNLTLLVRTAADPAALLSTVEREVRGLDKGLALVGVETIDQRLHQGLWPQRMGATLLGLFGLLALILAAGGIYGVTSFVVAQRSREIGIRMALGARGGDVLGIVLRQGMQVVAVGVALGVIGALALSRLAVNFLFGVKPTDPWTFAGTVLLLSAVAFAANFLPARRASGFDPVRVLRQE